jgi:hypothetical protein
MTRGRCLATLAALVAVGVLAGAGLAVAPGATLDQSNPPRATGACSSGGWAPDTPTDYAAQTFTAGTNGSLKNVLIPIGGTVAEVTVTITSVDGSGQPVLTDVLASASVPLPKASSYTVVDVLFSTPAKIQAGKQYAIVLSAAAENFAGGVFVFWQADLGASVSGPGGVPCPAGIYTPGRAWTKGLGPLGADADFFFQTYVEPSTRLTVQKAGTGSGTVTDATNALACGSTCAADFPTGFSTTLTAVAEAGSIFAGWSGDACSGTSPTCSFSAAADATITATFTAKATLVVKKTGAGKVASRPAGIACGSTCKHQFVPGPLTLTAKASAGWRFLHWQGSCRGTRPTCHLTLKSGKTARAAAAFGKKK